MNSLAIAGPVRRATNARRAVFPRSTLLAMAVISAVVMTWAAGSFLELEATMRAVAADNAELNRERAAVEARNQDLRREIERLGRDDYIETVARKQLGLIRPGEIPYMALQEQPAAPKTPAGMATPAGGAGR